jgi:putative transposase
MPRTARAIVANCCYHVLNRGNKKARIFNAAEDYVQFQALMARAQDRLELPILAACLMPNHIHLVVQPRGDEVLRKWMHWVFTTHVRWHHAKYETTGRLWQGRYKAFAIQTDHHLQTVMRYVERNPVRAKLVERAEDWRWGSSAWRRSRSGISLEVPLAPLPAYWRQLVNEPQSAAEIAEIRTCVNRQRPFGAEDWVAAQAKLLGVDQSIAPIGRPRKSRRVPDC